MIAGSDRPTGHSDRGQGETIIELTINGSYCLQNVPMERQSMRLEREYVTYYSTIYLKTE